MPVAHSLKKVQNKVGKEATGLHERSRKLKQIQRAALRQDKLDKEKSNRSGAKDQEVLKVLFFQQCVKNLAYSENKAAESFTRPQLYEFAKVYIQRNDTELNRLKEQRRPGRPKSNRQDLLELQRKKEMDELKLGTKVPDLLDPDNVTKLDRWNGSKDGMTQLTYITISDKDKPATE